MAKILIADDERNIRDAVQMALEGNGHDVIGVGDGHRALEEFRRQRPDIVLLDVMMPYRSGYDVCLEIRREDTTVPILLLTAKNQEEDRVVGLGMGADDYIAKPFSIRELLLRVGNWARRIEGPTLARDVFSFADGVVKARRLVYEPEPGIAIPLSSREVDLMRLFADSPGVPLTRAEIYMRGWGGVVSGNLRTIDTHVSHLRRKLGSRGKCIEAISGWGYRYVV